jgi:hypothetical protein
MGLRAFISAALAVALSAGPTAAQSEVAPTATVSHGALIIRLGTDTMAAERFARTASRMEGMLVSRTGGTRVVHYVATLGADGAVERLDLRRFRVINGNLADANWRSRMDFDRDSATIETTTDSVVTRRVAARDAFPLVSDSYALHELWLARVVGGPDSNAIPIISPFGGPTGRLPIRVFGVDSVHIGLMGRPIRVMTDRVGRVLGIDGTATLLKYTAERVERVDVPALARRFAALDDAGEGLGSVLSLSPRDTAAGSVDGAALWVDYGRPSRRGRDVFAHGVLGDTIWRAGANAATQFSTARPLRIGGQILPAGRYSLFVLAGTGPMTLIVNGMTGQWGTLHDPSRDVLRVPFEVRPLAEPVERFTIEIRSLGGRRGVLELSWDTKALAVPFEVLEPTAGG